MQKVLALQRTFFLNGKLFLEKLEWKTSLKVSQAGIECDGELIPWKNAKSWVVGTCIYGAVLSAVNVAALKSGRAKKPSVDEKPTIKPDPYPVVAKQELPSFTSSDALRMRKERTKSTPWWETDIEFQKRVIEVIIGQIKKGVHNLEEYVLICDDDRGIDTPAFFRQRPLFVIEWLKSNGYDFEFRDFVKGIRVNLPVE